jgi:hypothetical protein
MLNFVYLRSSRLNFSHFWLDSCIANKGEKFGLEKACCTHLEGFQLVSSYFWALAVSKVASVWPMKGTGLTGIVPRCWAILPTGLTGEGDRFDQSGLGCFSCLVWWSEPHAFIQGELHWFSGSLHVCRGSSLCFSGFGLVVCTICLSIVCLGCVELLPMPKGSETCLLQVILLFAFVWLPIACWSFFLFVFFSFLSSYYICVLSRHSSRGRLRTMCGLRTGRWSLPGVMSDWQRCVDWFFAKYRCRLRLDWCWCRWRTSAKGRSRWGLQVWWRQVGFLRGTRWPTESSVGRMVAWTTRWSHGRSLGWASKPRLSWNYVGAESWVVIGRGYTEFAGFPVVHQKTTRFLGWSTKPRPKNWRRRCSSIGPVWPVGTDLTGEEHRSDRCATTQSGIFEVEDTRRDGKACVEAK